MPLIATAQPTLIIRLQDNASAALVDAFEAGAGKAGQYASLFDGVVAVEPIFARPASGKRADSPFRAYTFVVSDSSTLDHVQAAWAGQEGVAYVQQNHQYRLDAMPPPAVDDPLLDSLAHMAVIRAYEAWNITTGAPDVRIGFVDTGVYFDHPDLSDQFWINPGEDLNGNGRADTADFNDIDDDGNGFVDDIRGYDFVDRTASVEQGDLLGRDADASEDNQAGGGRGHGTLIAGVMAAGLDNGVGIAGVAPGCRIVPLRAFGADGLGEDDDVAAAIVYGAQMGLDVLNLSFGDVYYSPIMQDAIAFAVSQGTVVVASAGNLGGDDPHYPSDYPEVVSVAWLDAEGTGIAGRGTYGIGIDLGAPGSFIYTTLFPNPNANGEVSPNGAPDALYGRRSGSSLAAPMVSGAAALLRSVDPSLSPASIQSILTGSTVDLGEPGWDHRTGAGRLDVAGALMQRLPARVEITSPEHDTGWSGDTVAIIGSVVTPSFASYALYYAEGDEDPGEDWTLIAGPFQQQHVSDTLAVWQVDDLPEGAYTLRLVVTLRTGHAIEDRRRLYLDRSAPVVHFKLFNVGLIDASYGIVADLATDDLTEVTMHVTKGGKTWTVASDRKARRHKLIWTDEVGQGGMAQVAVTSTNVAGLEQTVHTQFAVPSSQINTALLDESVLNVPHGYLLDQATDYDGDGLLEITLNRYQDGWIGDTLATYEWDGKDFRRTLQLVSNVIPRDVGDPDGDGLLDLLTQVAGATLVLEQPEPGAYPLSTSFIDTTGLANPFDPDAAFGARLTDLDEDGKGEILVHNTRQWRVLEYNGASYDEVSRLDNPTSVTDSEISQNEFQQPVVLIGDFDGDRMQDLLTGDGDGDWIIYEATGDNTFKVAWTYETTRYNAGARFAGGDFDGDGLTEFVTYTQNWTQPTGEGEREPDIGLYYFWDQVGDDAYVLVDSLPVPGLLSRHGSMRAVDFDGDRRDELVLIDAPNLYVLSFDDAMRWTMRFQRGVTNTIEPTGMRSVALVADDFDGDGSPELIAAGADERLHRFLWNGAAFSLPPPGWERAVALDDRHVSLSWRAPAADSVTVYRGDTNGPYDPIRTTASTTWIVENSQVSRYALRGWYQGNRSPLSEPRTVRPHTPALVESITYPDSRTVELVFSEPLAVDLRADQFVLDAAGSPDALLLTRSNQSVLLRFDRINARQDTLRWVAVVDDEGTPVGQNAIAVDFPVEDDKGLIISKWAILDAYTLTVTFSEALDAEYATDASNFRMEPTGRVVRATWSPEQAADVQLEVEGRAIGATGLETSLIVERMRSITGKSIAPEGNTISLSQAADNLANVYVFPNPYRENEHEPRMVVAGLPPEATIEIYSVQGVPVRRLEERDGDGGVAWDLNDEEGRPVPSGIYLIRVEATDQKPILRKAAVIR